MRQKLTERFNIYIKFKDITTEFILIFQKKLTLLKTISKFVFTYFVNDNIKETKSFETLFQFLHNHYFFRLI